MMIMFFDDMIGDLANYWCNDDLFIVNHDDYR